jgi:hypothetical protein
VDFWFVIETKLRGKDPYLHGAVAITEEERSRLKCALLVASNAKGDFKKFAVRTKPITYGFGVAGYARKSLSRTTLEFPGRNVTATTPLKGVAEEIFERDREWIISELLPVLRSSFQRRQSSSKRPLRAD